MFALVLAAAVPAHAQIYRWVDDRGVVNYANKPPADGRQAARVDTQESRLSVIPIRSQAARINGAPPPALVPAAAAGFPSAVDRLTVSNVRGALEWRERCFAERRVDCTNPTAATYDFGTAYSPMSPSTPALR
jgi:hypothetical protein